MVNGRLILVTGGIRSGKSHFAEKLASEIGKKVTYIATAEASDDEMEERVRLHKERRPQSWDTVEEQLELEPLIKNLTVERDCILIDNLSNLISNHFIKQEKLEDLDNHRWDKLFQEIKQSLAGLADTCSNSPANIIIVTDEVGLGLVSPYSIGRKFQDLLGWANQQFAQQADQVYLVIAGIPINVKELDVTKKIFSG